MVRCWFYPLFFYILRTDCFNDALNICSQNDLVQSGFGIIEGLHSLWNYIIERCYINQYHLLTVYSWSVQYLCSREPFSMLMPTTRENTLFWLNACLALWRLHTLCWSLKLSNVNLSLWRELKKKTPQFCRLPNLFLQYFLWQWELYESRGLNRSKEHIWRNVRGTVSLCLTSTTETFW